MKAKLMALAALTALAAAPAVASAQATQVRVDTGALSGAGAVRS